MTRSGRPAVEDRLLPAALVRVVNPVLRTLRQSPLHPVLSPYVMLLHVTGRRSGQVVAEIVGDLLVHLGPRRGIRLGPKVDVDRLPTTEELRAALVDRGVLRLSLLDTGPAADRRVH